MAHRHLVHPHFSNDTKDFHFSQDVTSILHLIHKSCEKNVDTYTYVLAPVKVSNEVNNDKQEVKWINYDVCPSKLGQLSAWMCKT